MAQLVGALLRGEGVALVRVTRTRSRAETLWTRGRCRKRHRCLGCDRTIEPGELAYRTLHSTDYRMERACEPCIETLDAAQRQLRTTEEQP